MDGGLNLLSKFFSMLLICAMAIGATATTQRNKKDVIPGNPETELQKGIAFYEQGLFGQAVAEFKKAIDMRDKYPEAYLWRGIALIEINENDLAYASFQEALRLRKDYTEAHYLSWLTLSNVNAGFTPLAYKELSAASTRTPDLPRRMHYRLGEAFADNGLLERSIEELRKAASMQPPAPISDSYFSQLTLRFVEDIKNDIARHSGSYADGHMKLARAMMTTQNYDGAVAEAKLAIEQRESFPAAFEFISNVNLMRKNYADSIAILQDFLGRFPTDNHVGPFRGRIAVIRKVAELPETAVVTNPDSAIKLPEPPKLVLTDAAKASKVSGSITVEATFTGAGTIENPVVVQGLGYGLDERAMITVLSLKYEPAMKDGKPVAVRQKVQLNFAN
jgi:tetratricopeptide (TPR) repeat protein